MAHSCNSYSSLRNAAVTTISLIIIHLVPAQLCLLTYSQIFDDQIIFQAIIYEMHGNKPLGMKLMSQ